MKFALFSNTRILLDARIPLSSEWVGGGSPPPPPPPAGSVALDVVTGTAYQLAIATAKAGAKRVAGAQTIVAAIGTAPVLTLFRNGAEIATMTFTGRLVITTDGTDIWLALPPVSTAQTTAADVTSGTWTFAITAGTIFPWIPGLQGTGGTISGAVATGGGAGLALSVTSLSPGITGFDASLMLVIPATADAAATTPTLSWINFANNIASSTYGFDGVNAATYYFSGGRPTGLTATLAGAPLAVSNFAVTESFGSAGAATGMLTFNFNNPDTGLNPIIATSTGTYGAIAPSVTLLTA